MDRQDVHDTEIHSTGHAKTEHVPEREVHHCPANVYEIHLFVTVRNRN